MARRVATFTDAAGVRRVRTHLCGGVVREVTFGEGVACAPCGGCPAYYLATLCNPTCAETPPHAYVCATRPCFLNTPQQAPLAHNQVIRFGPRCYTVNTQTRYCPPSVVPGVNDPADPPCVPMPVWAPVLSEWDCVPGCGAPHCLPIGGYFKLKACSNTPAFGVQKYVCCELYEHALGLHDCPVFGNGICGSGCWYVEPGTTPVEELPPGAEAICFGVPSLTISATCCQCCPAAAPGCCLCTADRLILRRGSACEPLYENFAAPCSAWEEATGGVVGGGYQLVSQMNFGNLCPVQLNCWRMISATTLRLTIYTFTGVCEPGAAVQCSAGVCARSVSAEQLSPPASFDFEIGRCEPMQNLFAPGQLFGVPSLGSCGPGQCNWSGIRYADCRSMTGSLVNDLTGCNGQKYEECFAFERTAAVGVCGDDNCGHAGRGLWTPPGLVLADGSPADSIGTVAHGCSGCGSSAAASRF